MSVVITHRGAWAEIRLDRPDRRNAITGPLGEDLAAALEQLAADERVQVIMLAGAGGAFCSGLDLKAFNADPKPDWVVAFPSTWRKVHVALFNCQKPIVGALQRYAINGGAALALACDLLVVGESSFLQVGEVQQGMAAPYNMAWLHLRHPEAVAARLALVGRRYIGEELLAMGIAHQVVDEEGVLEATEQLVQQLSEYPAGALQRIKSGLRAHQPDNADEFFDAVLQADPLPRTLAPQSVSKD